MPTLPPELQAPTGNPQNTVTWWRQAAEYFQSRATRAEITSVYAVNRADEAITVAENNARAQIACTETLRARDEANAGE